VKPSDESPQPAIPAIVLAAGGSIRMGRSKARLPIQPDGTFLGRILRTLAEAGLDPLIAVTRERLDIPSLWHDARSARVIEVINPEPARGQLSSLLCGLDAIAQPPQAVLMTLVDVPLPAAATVRALVASWHRTRVPLVRPLHAGRHGHPVIFGEALLTGSMSPLTTQVCFATSIRQRTTCRYSTRDIAICAAAERDQVSADGAAEGTPGRSTTYKGATPKMNSMKYRLDGARFTHV